MMEHQQLMRERQMHAQQRMMEHQHRMGQVRQQVNVDGMSYDQLLQMFGDGSENRGAQEGELHSLPTAVVQNPENLPSGNEQCSICLEDFAQGDTRKILPCLHGFHADCVDRWLRSNNSCPICKNRIN
jgi:hypothetical protein